MPDITKCEGTDCPLKENCYRFTATDSGLNQSYFEPPPIKDGKCDEFWEDTHNKNLLNNK
jgi:hypothetical protein